MTLLQWRDLRIDHDGVLRFDGDAGSSAEGRSRLLVLGAPRALFLALAGELSPARGRLLVDGVTAEEARRTGKLAAVRFDAPLPLAWTAERYVVWTARLGGMSKSDAKESARRSLDTTEVDPRATIGSLDELGKRRLQLAAVMAAHVGDETIFAIDDPFVGQSDASSAALEASLLAALGDHPWMVFATRAPLASRFAGLADHAFVMAGSDVLVEGTAASIAAMARTYIVRFASPPTEAFPRLAAERGIELSSRGDATVAVLPIELGSRALFELAEAASSAIVELRPLAGPLA